MGSNDIVNSNSIQPPKYFKLTQSHAMMLPRRQIIRAIYGNTATLDLSLHLVFPKQEELSSLLIDGNTTRMRVYQLPISIPPSRTRNNPFRRSRGSN